MISVEDLRFAYTTPGDELFDGLSHTFQPGEISVVTGPSGAGKSTLLYLIGLMLTPSSGRVLWDGLDASSLSDGERSRLRAGRVGFVFQDAALDPTRTVAANVMEGALYAGVPRRVAAERRRSLLDLLGVRLREVHRPGEVSGGQAQRVALARAMIKRPDIILADEPTGNLDEQAAQAVLDSLSQARSAGATVVVATHMTELAAVADSHLKLI